MQMRISFRHPFGHQESVVIFESELPVQGLPCDIAALDFKMQSRNAKLSAPFFDELHGLIANALTSVICVNEEFINEGVAPLKFKTVAERHSHIANCFAFTFNQPEMAQRRIVDELFQSRAGNVLRERIAVNLVKLAHKAQEQFDVGDLCNSKIDSHVNSL